MSASVVANGEEEYRKLALQAQTDTDVHLVMHQLLMMLLSSASSLPAVSVRIYHDLFGVYGDVMTAYQLPDPYTDLFFHRAAIWERSAVLAHSGEDLPTVRYVCLGDDAMQRLICDPELPSLIFGG